MRAQVGGEGDVFRLVELACEIARLQHRAQHRRRISGIGAQIAVAQIVRGKQRRPAREIEHDVAARGRAVTDPSKTSASREEGGARQNRR